jgi:hypothetical protein
MRSITKVLLTTCAVFTVAQVRQAAHAQAPNSNPPSPDPTAPNPSSPTSTDPTNPNPTSPSPTLPSPGESPTTPTPIPDTTSPSTAPLPPGSDTTTTTSTSTTTTTTQATPIDTSGATVNSDVGTSDSDDMYSYAWYDERLASGIGVGITLGGGVTGFTDKTMRSTTSDVGGLWDLRLTFGTHVPLALDVSYLGSATSINGLPSGRNATLLGTTVEGALRYNILPHFVWTPYVFGGAGWTRYDVTQTNVTLSDSGMNDKDNLMEFPMGVGFSYRASGFTADLRGTFRATTDQNLVLKNPSLGAPISPTSSDFAPMHTWEASAALGYEF